MTKKIEIMTQVFPALVVVLVALAICYSRPARGAPPPAGTTAVPAALPNATQEFLDAHNQARSLVRVEPLKWNDNLAKAASLLVRHQRDKMDCNFADLNNSKYGGNQQYAGSYPVTPRMAVMSWVNEGDYYNYKNNSCAPGHEEKCGVYTQVVWKNSLELGCAQATCNINDMHAATLTICFYNPPGNVRGERPYNNSYY